MTLVKRVNITASVRKTPFWSFHKMQFVISENLKIGGRGGWGGGRLDNRFIILYLFNLQKFE